MTQYPIVQLRVGSFPTGTAVHAPRGEALTSAERAYLERRAEAELAAAQAARHPAAVRAHYLLASEYLDRLYGEAQDGQPRPVQARDSLARRGADRSKRGN